MSKRTPQSWTVESYYPDARSVTCCRVVGDGSVIADRLTPANAALIAAAPDLLAAAEQALGIVGCYTIGSAEAKHNKPVAEVLRAAIAKAKGE
jgi:hypothetical protein